MKHKESGRSMIEILGVLSIIALLSIIGLEGYRWAMNKSKANEITKQIMIRAQEVSSSLQQGTDPEEIIDDVNGVDIFPAKYNDKTHQYDSGELPLASDKRFAVGVDKVSPDICKELMNSLLGSSTGIQKVQQRVRSSFKELSKASDCSKETLSELGFVFQADLTNNCEPGRYRVDAICQDAPDGYISDGTGEIEQCDKGMTSNKTHTECVNCKAGEKCGCEKMANGDGGCIDCIKNKDCGTANGMCSDKGACYACPAYADCNHDQGFTCLDGYEKTLNLCCPKQANCTIDETGKLKINCSKDYYLANDLCKECPINADCLGGEKPYSCKSGFTDKNGICCPTGATCTPQGDDYTVSCPKNTYLSDKKCLPCPTNATCNGGTELPKCPAGYTFAGIECSRKDCRDTTSSKLGTYDCYLNGKRCGHDCTSTDIENDVCQGYCSSDLCPSGSHLGNVSMGWSGGFGCIDNKTGLYCAKGGSTTSWYCMASQNDSSKEGQGVCCTSSKYGVCEEGSCDSKICQQFNSNGMTAEYAWLYDARYGCKITKENVSTYCSPLKNGNWYCKTAPSKTKAQNYCGTCTVNQLKQGSCGDCFSGVYNCQWGTWNSKHQRCVGQGSDGETYSCNLNGECYIGDATSTKRCGNGCLAGPSSNYYSSPEGCEVRAGLCNKNKCVSGTEYFWNSKRNIAGCRKPSPLGGYVVYEPGSWNNYICFYGTQEDNINTVCGRACNTTKDCSDCQLTNHVACYTSVCNQNGQEIKDCICNGNPSNGHCCAPGNTYINGGCSIVGDTTGKCLFKSFILAQETDEYKADTSGNCQCTDVNKCLSEDGLQPACLETTETLQRDAQGKCKAVSPT